MSKLIKYISFVFLIVFLAGCSLAYKILLGVDSTPDWNLAKNITKQAKKYNIPPEYNLILDTVDYYNGLKTIYKSKLEELKITDQDSSEFFSLNKVFSDDNQPVQFRLFDNAGAEVFKIVNCYVDPPIPMSWNVGGCFDTFPPKTTIENLNKHYYDLDFVLAHASYLDEGKITREELPRADYYGVIIWNEFFKRPSRKLIKTVKKNIRNSKETVVLLYINNQNAYLWQIMDSESKENVKAYYRNKAE